MKTIAIHAAFVLFLLVASAFTGLTNMPGAWYAGLEKPFFQPPAAVFAPVWTVLYILIGIAGARTWIRAPASGTMQIWFLQMILNFLWPQAFFGLQSPALGLLVIVPLLVCILIFIAASHRQDRAIAWLFAPYALWTAFAAVLNAAILILN